MEIPINYLAVLAATVANMVIGFLWFGPLFGKAWTSAMGWTEAEMAAGREKMKKDGWKTYALQALSALVMAYVTAHYFVFASTYTQTFGVTGGLMVGFWSWLGFVAPVTLGVVLWDGKPWKLWFVQSGYYLAALLSMGVIIAVWQ